ncbi:MAG: hypothetical protein RMA76_24580 [Deltaproteobacteria bacterium]|jgi:hypothetical protein
MPVTPRDSGSIDHQPFVPGRDANVGAQQPVADAPATGAVQTADAQDATTKADAPARTQATRKTGFFRKLLIGAAVVGTMIAAAVGGSYIARNIAETQINNPVAPIEAPLPTAPGTLPDGQAPPGEPGEVDVPVRGPTLPGVNGGGATLPDGSTLQPREDFTPRNPITIRIPDQRVP